MADASVLVAELIRARGRALMRDPRLSVVVTEEQWSETQYELEGRLRIFIERGRVPDNEALAIRHDIQMIVADKTIEVVLRRVYHHLEATARRRIPRDPNDWPTVALAISFNAGILTNDYDFFGCGCPTWTMETLRAELAAD